MVADRAAANSKDYIPLSARGDPKLAHPRGREFFFSGVLIKVEQIPNLFMDDAPNKVDHSYSFVVLIFQKDCRKRHAAHTEHN
jgi:hypothetical protein